MKKTLLLSSTLAIAATAMAATEPVTLPDAALMGVSQNGRYTVSNLYGMLLEIVDLESNEPIAVYFDDVNNLNEYTAGYGTPVANDGSVVGNATLHEMTDETHYTSTDNAVIFKEGELTVLPVPNPEFVNMAHSITPDGSMICGIIGNAAFSMDARDAMALPAIWVRNADGSYADPVVLPHPDKDFFGSVPQYITAVAMSQDGKTVAGTVTSGSGLWIYPIVYKCNASGEWSYSIPNQELFFPHPEVVIPEAPGEYPTEKDFMTAEEIEAYNTAMANWDGDWNNYPYMPDFMSESEAAEYAAACTEYENKQMAYQMAIDQATEGAISLIYNNVVLTPDGKFYGGGTLGGGGGILLAPQKKVAAKYSPFRKSSAKENPLRRTVAAEEEEYDSNTPYLFNLEDGTYKKYTSQDGFQVTCAAEDGSFVGYSGDIYMGNLSAGVLDQEKGIIAISDYYAKTAPSVSAWIQENCLHEVQVDVDETGNPIYGSMLITGIPFCTPDMTVVTSYAVNVWDGTTFFDSYVFSDMPGAGTKLVEADGLVELRALPGGIVAVSSPAAIDVFSADGACVFKGNGEGEISTGLSNGIYVVRARFADGKVRVCKAAF